uniref:Uncharacterized protein n=1 Tax=Hyaloperonospora arabidopsidis (strain Emoy2) TaxID=559515 RepID=M4B7K4_HYAAE
MQVWYDRRNEVLRQAWNASLLPARFSAGTSLCMDCIFGCRVSAKVGGAPSLLLPDNGSIVLYEQRRALLTLSRRRY